VKLWERILAKTSEGDVRIVARGGEEVRAHSLVLEDASCVLGAMLRSPMCEVRADRSRVIRVDDLPSVTREAVEAFLSLVYTSCLPPSLSRKPAKQGEEGEEGGEEGEDRLPTRNLAGDHDDPLGLRLVALQGRQAEPPPLASGQSDVVPVERHTTREEEEAEKLPRRFVPWSELPDDDVGVLVRNDGIVCGRAEAMRGAFELCHRFGMADLAKFLEPHLADALGPATFEAFLQSAVVRDAETLRRSCHAFAWNTPAVRIAFDAGAFDAVVRKELLDLFADDLLEGQCANQNHKRRRKVI